MNPPRTMVSSHPIPIPARSAYRPPKPRMSYSPEDMSPIPLSVLKEYERLYKVVREESVNEFTRRAFAEYEKQKIAKYKKET